jgi:hypothetical protein
VATLNDAPSPAARTASLVTTATRRLTCESATTATEVHARQVLHETRGDKINLLFFSTALILLTVDVYVDLVGHRCIHGF